LNTGSCDPIVPVTTKLKRLLKISNLRHSAAQHRKGRSLSSDLAAPMTGEIERQLEELVLPLIRYGNFKDEIPSF
jgi:hypothetical protein